VKSLAVAAALALLPAACFAEKLETTHLFGFTLGSDVNDVGEKEAESESTGRFGKGAGAYTALSQEFAVKFIPFQDFSIEPSVGAAYHDIFGVPGFDDRHQVDFDTLSLEMRYRVLNRQSTFVGLTLGADLHWGQVDDLTGEPGRQVRHRFLDHRRQGTRYRSHFRGVQYPLSAGSTSLALDRRTGAPISARDVRSDGSASASRPPDRRRSALHA
jgi:hypothetical protein